MLSIKSYSRKRDFRNFLALTSSLAAVLIITSPCYINAATNNTINSENRNATISGTTNNLITNILAKNLENHLQKAGAILEITSKLPQVRNVPFAHLLNQTIRTEHGIPQYADTQKRQIAQNILSHYKDLQIIVFIMPNGDIYFAQPYSRQQISTTTNRDNLGFRDYFQGVVKTKDIYLGNPSTSVSSGQRQSVIAVPVFSLKDNSTLVGVWGGGMDFGVLNKELQSLNLTSLDGIRVVYVGHNGEKIADSDINSASRLESFANLNSFKNAINGHSGSTIDTVDNTKMIVTYQPVKIFHNTWVVLLMQRN